MMERQNEKSQTAPAWINAVMWVGLVTVILSFLALMAVLVSYFMEVTPITWLFWSALFAFPTGFIFLLIALVGNVFVRRQRLHT